MGDEGDTETALARTAAEVRAATRRKSAQELKLAGAARALAGLCPELDLALMEAVTAQAKRDALERPLFSSGVRAVGGLGGGQAAACLVALLAREDRGGLATCSAASLSAEAALAGPLAKATLARQLHVAFAAELARVVRGEADGRQLAALAPRLKEAHRIELTTEVLLPLSWSGRTHVSLGDALAVLRTTERHLGRWLLLAEPAAAAGDPRPLAEARAGSGGGATTTRSAWSLVAWALGAREQAPRPTAEHVARLSDRPSGDRDATFLFRLAAARVTGARALLEAQLRGNDATSSSAIRAALYLARDHGREEAARWLTQIVSQRASGARTGLALAALAELGRDEEVRAALPALLGSRSPQHRAWAILVASGGVERPLLTEARYRWLELGWLE